jgi:hypothetical protein
VVVTPSSRLFTAPNPTAFSAAFCSSGLFADDGGYVKCIVLSGGSVKAVVVTPSSRLLTAPNPTASSADCCSSGLFTWCFPPEIFAISCFPKVPNPEATSASALISFCAACVAMSWVPTVPDFEVCSAVTRFCVASFVEAILAIACFPAAPNPAASSACTFMRFCTACISPEIFAISCFPNVPNPTASSAFPLSAASSPPAAIFAISCFPSDPKPTASSAFMRS